jgi:streptomycin 6-kinase
VNGLWRSLVSALVWGTKGPGFKSRQPDYNSAAQSTDRDSVRRSSSSRAKNALRIVCDLAASLWRPVGGDVDLPTGAERALEYADALPRLWRLTGRPCSQATLDDAIECADRRSRAHDDRHAVLVHGDVHDGNALMAADGAFKLIDPDGLRAEPACDLGTILRCNPDLGDDLRARAARLAFRTGIDAATIWEWGTIYRVIGGLHSRRVGLQPFGDQLLAHADQLHTKG